MKSVITHNLTPLVAREKTAANMLVISDDLTSLTRRTVDADHRPTMLWNPEAIADSRSSCAWDLIGAVVDAPTADRIAHHLLSPVLDNRLASFFVPEAGLLTANMLLAAARSGASFADVLDWVWHEDADTPARLLREHHEFDAYEDVLTFSQEADITRGSIWETTQMALKPLNFGTVLDAVARPGADRVRASAPFSVLHVPAGTVRRPTAAVHVLRSVHSPCRGLAAALVDELLRAASAFPRETTVVELGTYGRGIGIR